MQNRPRVRCSPATCLAHRRVVARAPPGAGYSILCTTSKRTYNKNSTLRDASKLPRGKSGLATLGSVPTCADATYRSL